MPFKTHAPPAQLPRLLSAPPRCHVLQTTEPLHRLSFHLNSPHFLITILRSLLIHFFHREALPRSDIPNKWSYKPKEHLVGLLIPIWKFPFSIQWLMSVSLLDCQLHVGRDQVWLCSPVESQHLEDPQSSLLIEEQWILSDEGDCTLLGEAVGSFGLRGKHGSDEIEQMTSSPQSACNTVGT